MSGSALDFVFPLPFFVVCASGLVMGYREGVIAEPSDITEETNCSRMLSMLEVSVGNQGNTWWLGCVVAIVWSWRVV